jgi:thiol-disulfide isomerase/thioredoxin
VARDGGIVEQFPVRERAMVDPIAGRTIDGDDFDSRALAGKIIVYNIWGSWCGPCRKEAPDLKRLSEQMREKGVRFVGVDVKDSDANALAFQREFDVSYPSIGTADSGVALLALSDAVPLGAVPTTVSSTVKVALPGASWASRATTPLRA